MKALIIEDEKRAAANLTRLISEVDPGVEIVGELQTIDKSIEWFGNNPMPDVVFLDIHLADGSSFEIFKEVRIDAPIIFTTAYDEYALKAFEVNSVDYLLKPISKDGLERALAKIKTLTRANGGHEDNSALLKSLIDTLRNEPVHRSTLLVSHRDKLIPVAVKDIAYIFTEHKIVTAVTFDYSKYCIDEPLEKLSRELSPNDFFRINRQYIVSRRAIKEASVWFSSQLALTLTVQTPERLMVSRSNVKGFKKWLTYSG